METIYHRFELKISPADKKVLIEEILNSNNYKDSVSEMFDVRADKPRYSDKNIKYMVTYQDKWNYIYEYYKLNKRGNKPIWDRISISKNDNKLTYERILD